MTPLEVEESKLTGNIDSYAAWNNEIHKELKMKYYEEDNENRIDNGALTKQLNEDYNSRAFPVKYPAGQTPKELLEQEKILHEIELRNKTPMVINKTLPETATKYKSDILTKQNEKVMEQAKKDLKIETEQQDLDKKIDDEIEGKPPAKVKYDFPDVTKLPVLPPPSTSSIAETVLSADDISKYSDVGTNTINDTLDEIMNDLIKKNKKFSYEYDDGIDHFKISNDGKVRDYKLGKEKNTSKGYSTKTLTQSNYKPYFNKFLNALKSNDLSKLNLTINGKPVIMESLGIKSKSKSKRSKKPTKNDIEHYKSRFLILKGEVLCGNNNPVVINELKQVIKILDANKLLNKN